MSIQKQDQQQLGNELYRIVGVVLWVSFVASSVATMLFFATFDPLLINQAATFPMELSRTSSYSIGFFLFWILTASAGAIIAWLLSLPEPQIKKKRRKA